MTISIGNLEFRGDGSLIMPHEVFFATARKHFDKGEFDRSLALLNAYLTFDHVDPDAAEMTRAIASKGISERDIPHEVNQVVQEEIDVFASIPFEIRNRPISPAQYIAIHPFEGRKHQQDKWILKGQDQIRTQVIKRGNDLWGKCEKVEYEIFAAPDMQYYPENDEKRIADFDEFQNQEFLAASKGDRIIGVMRLVYTDETRLREGIFQTYDHREELNMFPEMVKYVESLDPRKMVDMTTMAIYSDERNSRASRALITRTIQRIWETGRRHAVACIDTPFYRKLKSRALDFQALGPSTFYWGSPTTACLLDTYSIPRGASKIFIPLSMAKGFIERALGG